MSDTLPGLGPVRRRTGPSARAIGVSLTAWRREGLLAGDEWAAVRSALRDAAAAVDASREAMRAGEGTAYTYATCARALFEMLTAVRPIVDVKGEADEWDAFAASLGAASVRDPAGP
jgi:hypothetical protein